MVDKEIETPSSSKIREILLPYLKYDIKTQNLIMKSLINDITTENIEEKSLKSIK